MNRFLFVLLLLGAGLQLNANNIEVTDIVLLNQDIGNETTTIQFDVSWENSWRVSVGPANYDAAWVFAKYRVGGGPWRHARLTGVPAGPSGASVDLAADAGIFVYRSGDGSGNISFQDVEMVWDYGADGVDPNAVVDVQVFALEMVYVPEGSFYLGTGLGGIDAENEVGEFRTAGEVFAALYSPYEVTSENAISVGSGSGQLDYSMSDVSAEVGDGLGPVPAGFPKGFNAFYAMKYEVSQAQYVAFFNTLTPTQRVNLDITGPNGKGSDEEEVRNGVSWEDSGNATTTLPDVPLSFTTNTVMLAYLDWSALRPMTETEYEKAGRGTVTPVNNEFAWGTASISTTEFTYQNSGTPNEGVVNPGEGVGNAIYSATNNSSISGPKRCGILAASAVNPTREETGGSYYGIMELSGNLYERCITVGNPGGRAFTGTHGNGTLLSNGGHDVLTWPSSNEGIGYRGGSYINSGRFIRLSDRYDAANGLGGSNGRIGFRGVRSAE